MAALACYSAKTGPISGIVFFAEHDGGLHTVAADSGVVRSVEIEMSNVGNLAYSPVNELLAFEASRGHGVPRSLFLVSTRGGRLREIRRGSEDPQLYRPHFDPIEPCLYAVNYSAGIFRYCLPQAVWTEVPVSGAPTRNTQGISLAPSGRLAAISPGDFNGILIARRQGDRFHAESRYFTDFASVISPRWIDDQRLVFAARRVPGSQSLWLGDLETGETRQITRAPIATRDFLSISPDRSEVVFTATDGSEPLEWRLWRVKLDGSDLSQVSKGGDLSSHLSPVWVD